MMATKGKWSAVLVLLTICLVNLGSSLAQVQPTQTYVPPPAASGNVSSDGSSGNRRWSELLGNALYYYDVQRAGTLPGNFRVSWRNDSVPNDGQDVNLNLSGGHFDAGNYIKATFPLCWVVTQLSWSATMYGQGYDVSEQTAYLDGTLRVMLDWLLTASSTQDQMVVLIGNSDFYWGGDQNIPLNNRPSYVVSREKPGTDVFGSCAGAFASASMLYAGTPMPTAKGQNGTVASMQDSAYAQRLLQRAQTLFDLAQSATPQQVYQKATKGVEWAYPSTDYADELVLSSAFLALATGNQSYADYAQQTYAQNGFPSPNGALNWDSKIAATPVLLAQLGLARTSMNVDVAKYQADAEIWMDAIVNKTMLQTFTTPGGLFWFEGNSDSASLNPSLNAAWLFATFSDMTTTTVKRQSYLNFVNGQLNYALGDNPMNAVYVVGQHPNSAQNPQSALASGGTDPKHIDLQPPQEAYVLYGGCVGGPDKDDNYYDERSNWEQTEVALDSQSPWMGLVARQLTLSNVSDPFYVGMTQQRIVLSYTPDDAGSGGGLSTGGKIAIAVVVIVVVFGVAVGLAIWQRDRIRSYLRRRRMTKV